MHLFFQNMIKIDIISSQIIGLVISAGISLLHKTKVARNKDTDEKLLPLYFSVV